MSKDETAQRQSVHDTTNMFASLGTSRASRRKSGEGSESHGDQVPRSSTSGFKFCKTFMSSECAGCPEAHGPVRGGTTIPELQGDEKEEEADEDIDTSFFEVKALKSKTFMTPQDHKQLQCEKLAGSLRDRPTLPADPKDTSKSWTDLKSGIALPVVSCSFSGCSWHGETDDQLKDHLVDDHYETFRKTCGDEEELWFHMCPAVFVSSVRCQLCPLAAFFEEQSGHLGRCN